MAIQAEGSVAMRHLPRPLSRFLRLSYPPEICQGNKPKRAPNDRSRRLDHAE
jgi:hypothetical protein